MEGNVSLVAMGEVDVGRQEAGLPVVGAGSALVQWSWLADSGLDDASLEPVRLEEVND